MGFRARIDNDEILSLNFDDSEWEELKKDKQNLKMICCDSIAVMKKSKYDLKFFSHSPKKACDFKPETIEHLMLKKYVYVILKELGYKIEMEKNISIDEVKRRPDVLLEINDLKIVFEIQNTKQNLDLIKQRSDYYINNNMIVVWLNLFNCTGYELSKFTINNDNIFVYDVKGEYNNYTIEDNLIRKKFDLKEFLQLKIEETLKDFKDVKLESETLIHYKTASEYFLHDIILIDDIIITQKMTRIERDEIKDKNFTLPLKVIKGFSCIKKSLDIIVEKTEILSRRYTSNRKLNYNYSFRDEVSANENKKIEEKYNILNNPPINEYNIDIYRKHYINKVIDLLKNMGFVFSLNKIILDKYQIDIYAEHKKNKIAFLTIFYSDPDIGKTVYYLRDRGVNVIILDFDGRYKYNNINTINCNDFKAFDNKLEDIMYNFCPF